MKAAARLAAVAAACAALWTVVVREAFVGHMADSVWYLEPARNWARGLGLVSRLLYPAHLAWLAEGARPPVPLLLHGPLSSLLIGVGYKIFGVVDWVPIVYALKFVLLIGLLIYAAGRRAGGERAGLLAAFLFWCNYDVIVFGLGALSDPPFILLITASWIALWLSTESRRPEAWLLLCGLALGSSSWSRLSAQSYWLGFFPAVLWLHWGRWRRCAAFFVGLAAALLPIALYFHRTMGVYFYSPGFYLLCWSPSFPGFRSATSYLGRLTSAGAALAFPMDFIQKALTGPPYAVQRLFDQTYNPYAMACLLFGLLARWKEPRLARLRALVVVIGLPVFWFNAMFSYGGGHYLGPLLPLFFTLAAVYFWRFLDENNFAGAKRWAAVAAFVALFLSPTATKAKDDWKSRADRRGLYEDQVALGAFARERTKPNEVIYSDSNRLVVWLADRASVSLPATPEDGAKCAARLPPDALLLTTNRLHSPDYAQMFRDAFRERAPVMGYVPCEEWTGKELSALLYRRLQDCPRPLKRKKA